MRFFRRWPLRTSSAKIAKARGEMGGSGDGDGEDWHREPYGEAAVLDAATACELALIANGRPNFLSRLATNSALPTGLPAKVPRCSARMASNSSGSAKSVFQRSSP